MSIKINKQTGVGILCRRSETVEFGTLGNLFELTDDVFTLVFSVLFYNQDEVNFFGGAGTGTRELLIERNNGNSRNGSLRITITDSAGNVRQVAWSPNLSSNQFYTLKIVSSGAGSGNLNLYVEGSTAETISAQTHDGGFAPDNSFSMFGGDANSESIPPVILACPVMVFDRALSSAELEAIDQGVFPGDAVANIQGKFPNIGLDRAITAPAVPSFS